MSIESKTCISINLSNGEIECFESQYRAAKFYGVSNTNVNKTIQSNERNKAFTLCSAHYTDKGIVSFFDDVPKSAVFQSQILYDNEGRLMFAVPYSNKSFNYILNKIKASRTSVEGFYKPSAKIQELTIGGKSYFLANARFDYITNKLVSFGDAEDLDGKVVKGEVWRIV